MQSDGMIVPSIPFNGIQNCRLTSPPLQRLHSSTDQNQTIHQFPAAVHLTAHDGLIAHSEVPAGL